MEKLLYNISEVAELLSVSRGLLYSLIKSGQIKVLKIGRARRISVDEINRFLRVKANEVT